MTDESSEEFYQRKVDRDLTAEERDLARRMLNYRGNTPNSFLRDLESARVVTECACDCGSIDFAIDGKEPEGIGLRELAEFTFGEPGSADSYYVFIFERGGTLAGIEFVWDDDEPSVRLPKPDELVAA